MRWRKLASGIRSRTVVEIEPVAERFGFSLPFVPGANDVEVNIAIRIGIEKYGIDIFVEAVCLKEPLAGGLEAAAGCLKQKRGRLPSGTSDEDVIEPVLVNITDG